MQIVEMIKKIKHFINSLLLKARREYVIILIILAFGLIFSSISFVNHYLFRTGSYDLGIYTNALYDYARFHFNYLTVMDPPFQGKNLFFDHFEPVLMLIAPLSFIFGSYTLLIVQICSILFGGYGMYRLILLHSNDKKFSIIGMIHFFTIWGIYSALGFDYHNNVIAAMAIPWFFLFFYKRQWTSCFLYFSFILICKENMSLWMFFISLALIASNLRNRKVLLYSTLMGVISILYFIVVIKVAIPSFSNGTREYGYVGFYSALGENFSDMFITIFTKPQYVFSLLFENTTNDPALNSIKTETIFMFIISGGIAVLYKPKYLIMLLPIFAQKLFCSDPCKWGLNYQYSIEFVPIITMSLFFLIHEKFSKERIYLIGVVFVVISFVSTMSSIIVRKSIWYSRVYQCFWQAEHYEQSYSVKEIYDGISDIPSDAVVCVQNGLLPHMALRDRIYLYPYVNDSEYIILLPSEVGVWPLKSDSYQEALSTLKKDTAWQIVKDTPTLLILHKKH